ncbi:hypothetical protein ELB75_06985 [Eikenella corrodens]|uniref:Uncharacterized protein n=1 Tax=Eikenella corrodens TaxID=539 RepID=A0A3S9SJY1_EIKCO|nr:hypothetical protein ELB75_06985 [Eikenella corrodens]
MNCLRFWVKRQPHQSPHAAQQQANVIAAAAPPTISLNTPPEFGPTNIKAKIINGRAISNLSSATCQ